MISTTSAWSMTCHQILSSQFSITENGPSTKPLIEDFLESMGLPTNSRTKFLSGDFEVARVGATEDQKQVLKSFISMLGGPNYKPGDHYFVISKSGEVLSIAFSTTYNNKPSTTLIANLHSEALKLFSNMSDGQNWRNEGHELMSDAYNFFGEDPFPRTSFKDKTELKEFENFIKRLPLDLQALVFERELKPLFFRSVGTEESYALAEHIQKVFEI